MVILEIKPITFFVQLRTRSEKHASLLFGVCAISHTLQFVISLETEETKCPPCGLGVGQVHVLSAMSSGHVAHVR